MLLAQPRLAPATRDGRSATRRARQGCERSGARFALARRQLGTASTSRERRANAAQQQLMQGQDDSWQMQLLHEGECGHGRAVLACGSEERRKYDAYSGSGPAFGMARFDPGGSPSGRRRWSWPDSCKRATCSDMALRCRGGRLVLRTAVGGEEGLALSCPPESPLRRTAGWTSSSGRLAGTPGRKLCVRIALQD